MQNLDARSKRMKRSALILPLIGIIREDLKFTPNQITPAADGGFIVTAVREIKAVPQPPYILSGMTLSL